MTADTPDRDPDQPADDADLIAYLDGELDPDASQQVEDRLAADPQARTQAEAYKKTFDLLDYLPKAEPSPEFATRTLTKLQPALAPPASASGSAPTLPAGPLPRRRLVEPLAWAAAGLLALAAGFAAHQATGGDRPPASPAVPLTDLPVIERLPLYLGIDDLDFLSELNKSDLFDPDDLTATAPPAPRTGDPAPSAAEREKLIELFSTLTPARRQQLRTLHQQLSDPALKDREAMTRTLEGYAVWLDRLPPGERKRVLDATPDKRMDAVFEVHAKQWREGLSGPKRQALKTTGDIEERTDLIRKYQEQEKARRHEWELARRQWKELTDKNQPPWPFNDPALTADIDQFVATAFAVDPAHLDKTDLKNIPQACRLTREELQELRLRREAATQEGSWLSYGALLLRLSEAHPTLPRPKAGEPVTRQDQLREKGYRDGAGGVPKARTLVGKWPDYALDVYFGTPSLPKQHPLGPCRADEMSDPIREFIQKKLTDAERARLERSAGRWPDYPRELIRIAREKDLSVPEVMLPGEPNKWKQFYQLPSGKK